MEERIQQEYELWDQFLERFPLEKIESMTLAEYSQTGSKDTFVWWMKSGLDSLGSLGGGSPIRFGIFDREVLRTQPTRTAHHRNDDSFTWLAKYGDSAAEAFSTVKSLIVQVARAARKGDFEPIAQADINDAYKWKIAFHYQDRTKPIVLNIFKKEVLAHYLQAKTGTAPAKATLASLHQEVMKLREGQGLLEYGSKVWREGTILQSYNQLKSAFFNHYPDFSTFINPAGSYLIEERNYKQELCTIFAEEFAPRLKPLGSNEGELVQLGKDLAAFFQRKLISINATQNLVGWRYSEFANKMDKEGYIAFAQAVARLTDPERSVDERIPEFITFLHQHSPDGKCSQAATRSLTTFFLFISDPKTHFFIKTEEINKLLKLFGLDKFNNDSLAPEEYLRVQRLAEEIYQLLDEDGLAPQDMIDVQSFFWSALNQTTPDEEKVTAPKTTALPEHQQDIAMTSYPLNQILYGPPGTGKTYTTATRAVQICDGSSPVDRAVLMDRYRELIAEKRISFVSFHQSFSYEEFIEGIRPDLFEQGDGEQEQLIYKVEDGLFKKICSMARAAIDDVKRPKGMVENLGSKNFFKMSVGGKYDPEVESFCFQNDYLSLGWGGDVDFSVLPIEKRWEPARDAIKQLMVEKDSYHADKRFAVQAMYFFKNGVDVGDIVIVAKGLNQVQAIGEVTGEYEYRPELIPGMGYEHFRRVRWLVKDAAIPAEKVLSKNFSQQSIYKINPDFLKMDYLEKTLSSDKDTETDKAVEPYVLIVDEINRANISKVLGELITLIEPDKRLGRLNEVTVKLPYSREEFGIPANLHIIGTMNTADRSLALMDTALRRRFEFKEMMPEYDLLAGVEVGEIKIDRLLKTINQRVEALYDREHTIGHAFFMPLKQEPSIDNLASIFSHKIIPLLAEYFFEDWQKIRLVLGDNQKTDRPGAQFILEEELENNGSTLFGNSTDLAMYGLDRGQQYVRNAEALTEPDAYIGIYDSAALQGE